jgi:hypothetical protein
MLDSGLVRLSAVELGRSSGTRYRRSCETDHRAALNEIHVQSKLTAPPAAFSLRRSRLCQPTGVRELLLARHELQISLWVSTDELFVSPCRIMG